RTDPFLGRTIADHYEIVDTLGSGGFSTVYRAVQKSLRRDVAVKILHAEYVDKPDKIRRFQQEAEIVSNLVHTNVAAVYDYGVLAEGQPYLVMELAEGRTIAELLDDGVPDLATSLEIIRQSCDGIAAAHR